MSTEMAFFSLCLALTACASEAPTAGPGGDGEQMHAVAGDEFDGQCLRIQRDSDQRYLDAYTGGNGQVVTRNYQANDTQKWCFTVAGYAEDISAPTGAPLVPYYTIQHRTFNGQFLDAYGTSTYDYRVVLRDAQNNASQEWFVEWKLLRQRSSGRLLDAYGSQHDHQAVTRSYQSDGSQNWTVGE